MKIYYHFEDLRIQKLGGHDTLMISGWCFGENHKLPAISIKVNGKYIQFEYKDILRYDIMRKYSLSDELMFCGFKIQNNDVEPIKSLVIEAYDGEKNHTLFKLSGPRLKQYSFSNDILFSIDGILHDDKKNLWVVSGWCHSASGKPLVLSVHDSESGDLIEYTEKKILRNDLYDFSIVPYEDRKCGFEIKYPGNLDQKTVLTISDGLDSVTVNVLHRYQKAHGVHSFKDISERIIGISLIDILRHIHNSGFSGYKKIYFDSKKINTYNKWFLLHRVSKKELQEQRKHVFTYNPLISILVPTFNTPEKLLVEMIESVRNQSYSNWELCIADGSDAGNSAKQIISDYQKKDPRIKVRYLNDNYGISGNTNKALELAEGEYTALFDHDDLLEENALYEIVRALQNKKYSVIYTDEDKLNNETGIFDDPNLKPDFSPDQLCSNNYITHFFVARTEIVRKVGGFRSSFDGSQDYDLIFRCVENAESVYHIPKVLYHWRIHEGSTASDPSAKMYCYEAGKNAIQAHYQRFGIDAHVEMMPNGLWGLYRTRFDLKENPLVSVIIAAQSNQKILEKCIASLNSINLYHNIEIIISCSKDNDILHHQSAGYKYAAYEGKYSSPAAYNAGAELAAGKYLLFLNETIEMINPESISELVGDLECNHRGIAGAKLLFDDRTVEHAGIIIERNNLTSYVLTGQADKDFGYQMRAIVRCNYSAVTSKCMLISKDLFHELHGFDVEMGERLSDVDLCLRARRLGQYIVYDPFSKWFNHVGKSSLYLKKEFDADEKIRSEALFRERWKDLLDAGDPFYNPNLAMQDSVITL